MEVVVLEEMVLLEIMNYARKPALVGYWHFSEDEELEPLMSFRTGGFKIASISIRLVR